MMHFFTMYLLVFNVKYHMLDMYHMSTFRPQRSVVDACGLCKQCLGQSSAFWAKFLAFLLQ